MASSRDHARLAPSSTRPLANTALDSLRDAVVVIDAPHKHFPIVHANAAAESAAAEPIASRPNGRLGIAFARPRLVRPGRQRPRGSLAGSSAE